MFYSKSTGFFYDESTHGSRTFEILDTSWVRPTIHVPQDDGDDGNGNGGTIIVDMPDESAVHPTITVPNPDCRIPPDAVKITNEQHAALLDAQSQGKRIQVNADGVPVAVEHVPTAGELTAQKTAVLMQARSLREIVLNRLAGIQLNTTDAPTITAIKAARTELLNITSDANVKAAADGETTKAAIMAAWKIIATALAKSAPEAASVFAGLGL